MSEVNGPKFSVNQVNYSGIQRQNQAQEEVVEPREQITDFSSPTSEVLGRSMLIKGNDSTNNDLKALIENPQIADNSDDMFETAYVLAQDAGIANPYEEAASASTTAI